MSNPTTMLDPDELQRLRNAMPQYKLPEAMERAHRDADAPEQVTCPHRMTYTAAARVCKACGRRRRGVRR